MLIFADLIGVLWRLNEPSGDKLDVRYHYVGLLYYKYCTADVVFSLVDLSAGRQKNKK